MRKKNCLTIFVVSLALLGLVSAPVMASSEGAGKVSVSGYAEFGIAVEQTDIAGVEDSASDMAVTAVELAFDAEVNEMVKVHALLCYERPFFHGPEGPFWDEAVVTIGDAEKFLAVGLMYAPFGAQQTHFPGDPAIAAPLTLVFGEAQAEAVAVGMTQAGLTAVVYGFKGKWDGEHTSSYGFDVNYKVEEELTVGVSYLSNVCESDTVYEVLDGMAVTALSDDYAGAAAYVHVGIADLFVEAEYMMALDGIVEAGDIEPNVMNIEVGANLEAAGKNLELVVKYAASDDAEVLELPETRYGIAANLELVENTTVSLAYLTDEDYAGDTTNTIVAVIGVEF